MQPKNKSSSNEELQLFREFQHITATVITMIALPLLVWGGLDLPYKMFDILYASSLSLACGIVNLFSFVVFLFTLVYTRPKNQDEFNTKFFGFRKKRHNTAIVILSLNILIALSALLKTAFMLY